MQLKVSYQITDEMNLDENPGTLYDITSFLNRNASEVSVEFDRNSISFVADNRKQEKKIRKFVSARTDIVYMSMVQCGKHRESQNQEQMQAKMTESQPQPEENLFTGNRTYSNERIKKQLNKLERLIYWYMDKHDVSERNIVQYLLTAMSNIFMNYEQSTVIKFEVGDIVDVNYGKLLKGETSGGHVPAIVADVQPDGMFFAIPLRRYYLSSTGRKNLVLYENYGEIEYTDEVYESKSTTPKIALLSSGQYLNANRINRVVGRVSHEAMEEVLEELAEAFNFQKNL